MKFSSVAIALSAAAGFAASASGAIQDINGLSITTRNFNDFPASVGFYQHNVGVPVPFPANQNGHISSPFIAGDHHMNETLPPTGGFANRHLAFFSADGGATSYSFDFTQGFKATACFTVKTTNALWAVGTGGVEFGFWAHVPRINDAGVPYTDEGGVVANTSGTTFLGGAGLPFSLFGEGGFPNPNSPPFFTGANLGGGMTQGEMIQTLTYVPPDSPAGTAYVRLEATDIVSGVSKDSGWLGFSSTQNGFGSHDRFWNAGTQFGFRFQNHPTQGVVPTDIEHTVKAISIIPAPGSLALLGFGGLLASRRRR